MAFGERPTNVRSAAYRDEMKDSESRWPDFVIIGTMKSGSTTLFRWLDSHPRVRMPAVKEPNMFCDGRAWGARERRYLGLFRDIPGDLLTGEASVRYTDPAVAPVTALRMRRLMPQARLVCILRHPVARMKSHYRHEVQRGREKCDFVSATSRFDNSYVRRSCYGLALDPWIAMYPPSQLHVTTYEDMFGGESGWERLLQFLDLEPIERPDDRYNVTGDKQAFSPVMSLLWRTGIAQKSGLAPASVRGLARRALLHDETSPKVERLLESVTRPASPAVLDLLETEVAHLVGRLPDFRPWQLTP